MNQISIRRINPHDGTTLKQLRISALKDSPNAFGGTLEGAENRPIHEYTLQAERNSISKISSTFFAFNNASAVGLIGAFIDQQSQKPFICSMWVHPEFRKLKIGTGLVELALNWFRENNKENIYLWVANDNINAICFYKKLGFTPTDTTQALPSNPDILETQYLRLG